MHSSSQCWSETTIIDHTCTCRTWNPKANPPPGLACGIVLGCRDVCGITKHDRAVTIGLQCMAKGAQRHVRAMWLHASDTSQGRLPLNPISLSNKVTGTPWPRSFNTSSGTRALGSRSPPCFCRMPGLAYVACHRSYSHGRVACRGRQTLGFRGSVRRALIRTCFVCSHAM
jgi:hypothetical protein